MGFFSDLFKGKKSETITDPYGTWNPLQKVMGTNVSDYLNKIIKEGAPYYTGSYTSPMTTGETDVLSRNARLSALGEQGLEPLLRGEFPEDYYQKSIYKPALKQYTEDIQPLIEEQYAGPSGGYWGGARAGAVSKGFRDLSDTLVSERAKLGYQAMRDVPTAIAAANQLSETGAKIQALPRLIQQYGLDQQYNEWVRTQEVDEAALNQALGFLDISTITREEKPGRPSMFQQIAGNLPFPIAGVAADAMSKYPEYKATESSTQAMMQMVMAMLGSQGGGGTTTPKPDVGTGNINRINAFYDNLQGGLR